VPANTEVFIPEAVVLAVGLDASLLANEDSIWQPAGYHVTLVNAAASQHEIVGNHGIF